LTSKRVDLFKPDFLKIQKERKTVEAPRKSISFFKNNPYFKVFISTTHAGAMNVKSSQRKKNRREIRAKR
jgi:hypothetical protein